MTAPRPSLRIVAGRFGGRHLASPAPASGVRPTAERTREAIFSMLGPIEGDAVLDLFCGSGALGLEALSRGAGEVTLVDAAVRTAERNVETLGAAADCRIVAAEALDWLAAARGTYDLVLCDPPYRLADRLAPELDKLLPPRLRPGGRIVVESSSRGGVCLSLPLLRERRYGATIVRIHGSDG